MGGDRLLCTLEMTARSAHHTELSQGGLAWELAAVSDPGPVRSENEDAWLILPLDSQPGFALLLADGMGGHEGGAAAAQAAVESVGDRLRADSLEALGPAVADANAAVGRHRDSIGGQIAGTTLVAAVIQDHQASVVNVGDSRAYVVRSGAATQVTADHSWVAEQVRQGLLEPQEAANHPQRSVLLRALTGEEVAADSYRVELRAGDVLLLCSDGVWEPLGDRKLAEIFSLRQPLDALATRACDMAIDVGSTDNVTVVACRAKEA